MNKEFVDELLNSEDIPLVYQKPFALGNGTFATNRYIAALTPTRFDGEIGDATALKPVATLFSKLPEAQLKTTVDINLLKQAIALFDDDNRIANVNLYPREDGSHYIEIIAHDGKAVLLAGMYPHEDAISFPTIKERFAKLDLAFNDHGAGI